MNKKITELRLQKEEQSLLKEPHQQALVTRHDALNFHFCLFGLEEDFAKGFYHGVLELPEDYPFSPPKIRFLTENGRFEPAKPICTTFTHYHKETWSSSWNIRTILTGLISFMYSTERGIGGVFDSPARRRALAKKSLANNLANPLFSQLFKQQMIARAIVPQKDLEQLVKKIAEKEAKAGRQRKELTSSEYQKEEESEEKLPRSSSVSGEEGKGEMKVVLEQNLEAARKKLHFEDLEEEGTLLAKDKTQQERHFE